MKPLFDLSLRYKVPLWGAVLIVMATVAVSLVLLAYTHEEMAEDIEINARVIGQSADATLNAALANDDIWRAYETLAGLGSMVRPAGSEPAYPDQLLLVDAQQRIVVSARPKQFPMFAGLADINPEFGEVGRRLAAASAQEFAEIDVPGGEYIHFAQRLANGRHWLIISYPRRLLKERFMMIARRSAGTGLLVLLVLLPFSWYWGNLMAKPLVAVAQRIRSVSAEAPAEADPGLYRHKDEVGQLYEAYLWMQQEVKAKQSLQEQLVRSERLAAVGQLSAGVAHEINNPLSGMLTAVDTLKQFGHGDFQTMKTVGLLERGLMQIKEIVGALLVQASIKGRPLSRDDIEDIRILMKLQADKKHVNFAVNRNLPVSVPVAATVARQVMINLLLNAIQAAPAQGHVTFDVAAGDAALEIVVDNDGPPIPPDHLERIFEPYSVTRPAGHGLGLWVTYQMVSQLHGSIRAESDAARTRFAVSLPLEAAA